MSHNPYQNLILRPRCVWAADIVDAARQFAQLPYSGRHSFVSRDDKGVWSGQMDCLRFVLFTLREVGLLAPDFDIEKMRRPHPKEPLETVLLKLLEANTDRIEFDPNKPQLELADILLMNYTDLNDKPDPHHIGLVSWIYSQRNFVGKFMHAENFGVNNDGRVYEQEITQHILQKRIHSVWRLRGLSHE